MRRIESVQVPGETRRMLRERLPRFLPTSPVSLGNLGQVVRPLVSDMEVLNLYLNLEFFPGDDLSRARHLYEQASQSRTAPPSAPPVPQPSGAGALHETTALSTDGVVSAPLDGLKGDEPNSVESNSTEENNADTVPPAPTLSIQITAASPSLEGLSPPPSFDELVERGWIRTSWGRFGIPRDIVMAVLRDPQSVESAFRLLVEERDESFRLRSGFNPSGILSDIANGVVTEQHRPGEIACVSRVWIAARLWDTNLDGANDGGSEQRIGLWVDRWQFLNCPQFAMSNQVERTSFEEFAETAISVLSAPSTTPGWEEFRNAARAPTVLLYPHRGTSPESIVPAIPATVVDRIQWMSQGTPEQTFHEYLNTRGVSLLTVLLNELREAAFDSLGLAGRLIGVAVERPVLLQQLVLMARRTPVLLADMLMVPSTCTLACSLIASWEFNDGGWNRDFQIHANHSTELLAFEDALALLGGHLDAGHVPSSELAALYLHVFELASVPRQQALRYTMLSLLREELTTTDAGIQDAVVTALIGFAAAGSAPMIALCAALDLASEGGCVNRIDPSEMVSLYLDVLLPRGERLGPRQLELKSAQSLVALALRCDETLRNRFLNAVDVPAWLRCAPTSPDQQYVFRDQLARRIRLHVRVLSRAIAGWPTEVPDELVDALSRSIHAGAIDHQDRGRVDAFVPGPGYGHTWAEEHPIALDLAAALRRLQGNSLQKLLTPLCQVEEPIVLAGIVANTPTGLNEQIRAHLSTLTPETSSDVWSWPALQARVEALLNAELPEIAEAFIAAERDAVTWGPIPGREISMIRANLRMLLLREDWTAIASYALPGSISEALRREAEDVLLFYRGIAELKKAEGNPAAAEAIFLELTHRHRGVTSYPINLFASRVHRLLGGNTLGLLSGEALSQARRYLAEAQRETRPLIQHSVSDLKALDSNRAMLLLASGQPRESLQVLLELRETNFDARLEGFRALAMARLGGKREALAVLTQAERVFGRSDFLSAIRENIDAHQPYATAPSLSLDDDPVPGIRQAFEAFARLGHVEQAEVLQSRGRLDLYLLEEVRGACASIVALAPMMRDLGMVRFEDDISGVLKQILRSRLLLPQWAVEDQSRGGFSSTGGVGERDIIVSKGSVTLAVIEALITDYVETGNLTSHFNKLLGYDTCRFFFHITYARRSNCAGILAHLRTACTTPPSGINYIRSENLDDFDSMPVGFKAHYEIDSRSIVVVFLALEIGQPIQRAAAADTC